MPDEMNPPASWFTHDRACNNCRLRKIKCGRERPRCSHCRRDDVQCDFSGTGKRVNHTKLLFKNVSGLEHRLDGIERNLERLTRTIQKGYEKSLDDSRTPSSGPLDYHRSASRSRTTSISGDQSVNDFPQRPIDRHIVRCGDSSSDRYYGPCTLVSMCNEFRDMLAEGQEDNALCNAQLSADDIVRRETVNSLLTTMCASVGNEEPFDFGHDMPGIPLPPRQFLQMASTRFFQQEDPALDVFCESTFWANVDRIYTKPFDRADSAWSLCFNMIILLGLKLEHGLGGSSSAGWQFAAPFISTIKPAVSCISLFMHPKLVNVQALALLGVVAQQYLQPSFTEAIFMQACLLARRMGLHQQRPLVDGSPSEQEQEQAKVIRSLFLRDKSLSISRGINCWLPTFDCAVAVQPSQTELIPKITPARLQLARVQEEIYRVLYSTESLQLSAAQRSAARSKIERNLHFWTEAYNVREDEDSIRPTDLHLEFLVTRIIALRSSSDPRHAEQVVLDARTTCRLVLEAGSSIARRGSGSSDALTTPALSAGLPTLSSDGQDDSSERLPSGAVNEGRKGLISVRNLVDNFAVPAFFALIKNIMWPVFERNDGQDFQFVQAISQLYGELSQATQVNNYTSAVSRTFKSLLMILQAVKPELFRKPNRAQHQQHRPEHEQGGNVADSPGPQQQQQADHEMTTSSSHDSLFLNPASAESYPPSQFTSLGWSSTSTSNNSSSSRASLFDPALNMDLPDDSFDLSLRPLGAFPQDGDDFMGPHESTHDFLNGDFFFFDDWPKEQQELIGPGC